MRGKKKRAHYSRTPVQQQRTSSNTTNGTDMDNTNTEIAMTIDGEKTDGTNADLHHDHTPEKAQKKPEKPFNTRPIKSDTATLTTGQENHGEEIKDTKKLIETDIR